MANREVHYSSAADGVSIAYSVEGATDLPPLVLLPAWVSHLEIEMRSAAMLLD